MKPNDRDTVSPTEVPTYQGRGTRGWRIEADGMGQDAIVIDAGECFGGEWPERQPWQIIDGQGRLSGDAMAPSVHVRQGDGYRFAAGERRLITAETRMRILITPDKAVEEASTPEKRLPPGAPRLQR